MGNALIRIVHVHQNSSKKHCSLANMATCVYSLQKCTSWRIEMTTPCKCILPANLCSLQMCAPLEIWLHIWVVFPRTGKMSQICHNLFSLELYCDQTVLFFQVFSIVLKSFCPLQSKNTFVLVPAIFF